MPFEQRLPYSITKKIKRTKYDTRKKQPRLFRQFI